MSHKPAWALTLAVVFAVAISPDAASAQRRVRITSVEIVPADAAIQVGRPQVFFCTAYDAENNPVPTATCVFASSNRNVARVDANGIATGVGVGTVIITARVGTGATAKSAAATITVTGVDGRRGPARPGGPGYAAVALQREGTGPADAFVVSPIRLVLVRGESRQLEYRAVRADGENAERVPIIFSVAVGGERLIMVDSVGLICALGDTGQATVRVEVPNNRRIPSRRVSVEVRGDSVRFARPVLWLSPGSVDTLAIEVPGQDRALNVRGEFQFSSSDPSKVRVSSLLPVVTAVAPGVARIIGESAYFTVSAEVRVHRPVVAGGLAASRTRVGLGVGERFPVAVQLLDDRRQPIGPATGLTWTSSNDSVARYADGHVQGIRVGRAHPTARTPWDSTVSVDVFVAGQLLVSARRSGRWDLYAMTADSVPRFDRLTSDSIVELEPAFSPDLTRIAYVAASTATGRRPGDLDLYVANADGSEPRRLTDDSAMVGSPVFVRPAGERIVFQSSRGGRLQLYEVALDGSDRRQLTTGENPNSAPDVSPDGAKLLFVSLRQLPGAPRNYDIWEMNRDGTGERRLTTSRQNEDSPQYSADGRWFYFLRDEGGSPKTKRVYQQSLSLTDTTAAQPITPVGMFVSSFSVTPDGGLLVLTRIENVRGVGDMPRVVFFNPATGAVTPVVLGPGEQLLAPVFRPATPRPR